MTITGYTGADSDVVIPSTISNYPVTSIGNYAFSSSSLTGVSIPGTVSTIGNYAFAGAQLYGVNLGYGVRTIGAGAFRSCANLSRVVLPGSVISLGDQAFHFSGLISADLGSGVTMLGERVFANCPALTNVTMGNAVTNIGILAFASCPSLRTFTIPSGVSSIGEKAFSSCSGLTNAIIGGGVSIIGPQAFASCSNLTAMYFQSNAPTPGVDVFSNCPKATVYFKPGATGWPEVPNLWAGRPTALWLSPFLVTFDAQGGTVSPTSMTVTNGKTYGNLPTPTRSGYSFNGWWTGTAGSGAQVTSQSVVTNTTAHSLYAKWLVPILEISPASTNFTSSMSSGIVNVAANIPWTATSNATWIAVTGGASGMTNGMVIFNVVTNPGIFARTGAVIVSGAGISKTCLVTQAGAAAALAITPTSTNFTSAAASGRMIGVMANMAWAASTNQPWLRITSGGSGSSNGTVTFSVATNPTTSSRMGGVIISGGGLTLTCTVIQTGVAVRRIIGVSGDLSFGNVVTGQEATATMTIANSGNTSLAVSGIGYPTGFSGTWNGSIAAGASADITVTFRPVATIVYNGNISVSSDATGGTNSISASGSGMAARPAAQDDEGFGVVSNRFGFNINWASGMVVVVDACSDLATPAWSSLQTNFLTNGTAYFGDPEWTNFPGRFYRLRSVP